MQKHPDADSFVREHLRQPANATTRLVFADWLEETGAPTNVAEANYIRLREQAERHGPNTEERTRALRQASISAERVRAKLALAARAFVRNPEAVLQLLPPPNVTVRVADYNTPIAVRELVPESVARENLVLPLDLQGRTLFAATPAHNFETAESLRFILVNDIALVGAEQADVQAAINRQYGQTETESVDCVSYESPLIGLEGDEVSSLLFGIFHIAFSSNGVTGFTMKATAAGCAVRYYAGETVVSEECYDPSTYTRLLEHLLAQPNDAEYTRAGYMCADLDIPLLSNRRFPVTLERPPVRDQNWFRLRFRW
ncbi:MAG TPA: TIGR02996 domain-containing protein [Gemmata sp.]